MRFSLLVSGLFAALAVAQTTETKAASTVATTAAPPSTVSLSPAQASQAACLKACAAGDVNCQAHCIAVPSPNGSQVNATTQCAAKCPQGNGSPSDTQKYSDCVQACITNNYFSTSVGTPEPTGASGGDSGSNSDSSAAAAPTGSASGSGSGSGSASPTGSSGSKNGTSTSGTKPSTTANAAPAIIGSGITILSVFAALLAL